MRVPLPTLHLAAALVAAALLGGVVALRGAAVLGVVVVDDSHTTVFPGESTDVPALLSMMDVLVAPSAEETFGLAIVEALAAGLPVLYSACPALDELPLGSVPGAQRLPADPDAIRDALAAAVRQGPLRRPAPPALDRFDMARVAARIDAVYRRVGAPERQPVDFPSLGR